MEQLQKIARSFQAFYDGDCWIGTNFTQALHGINASQAALKLSASHNSIWQLVNHLIYWRTTVMIRLTGKNNYPAGEDMLQPNVVTDKAWEMTKQECQLVATRLHDAIQTFNPSLLDAQSPVEGQTYHDLLMGCLQHDAYHMGQIIVLKKNV